MTNGGTEPAPREAQPDHMISREELRVYALEYEIVHMGEDPAWMAMKAAVEQERNILLGKHQTYQNDGEPVKAAMYWNRAQGMTDAMAVMGRAPGLFLEKLKRELPTLRAAAKQARRGDVPPSGGEGEGETGGEDHPPERDGAEFPVQGLQRDGVLGSGVQRTRLSRNGLVQKVSWDRPGRVRDRRDPGVDGSGGGGGP